MSAAAPHRPAFPGSALEPLAAAALACPECGVLLERGVEPTESEHQLARELLDAATFTHWLSIEHVVCPGCGWEGSRTRTPHARLRPVPTGGGSA